MKQAMKFTPYQKVLVRDTSIGSWRCDFYSYTNCTTHGDEYVCVGGRHNYCIPYEGNEHMLGTANEPQPKRWRAKKNCEYYYINSRVEIVVDIEGCTVIDNEHFNIGNYFRTKEEAEEMAVKFRALLENEMLKGGSE